MQNQFPFGNWAWLYPITFFIHILEEYLGGFYKWASRNQGIEFTEGDFLALISLALALISIAALLISRSSRMDWLLVCLAVVILLNVFSHSFDTAVTQSYSPGVLSGLVLWLPLGVLTLWKGLPSISMRSRWTGALLGILVYLVVYKMPGWVG